MTPRQLLGSVVAVLAAVATLGACGDDDSGQAASGVTETTSASAKPLSLTLDYLPGTAITAVKFGDQKGIFEKQGIQLKYDQHGAGAAASIAKLLNGQLDIGNGAITAVITAIGQNIPVQVISGMEQDYDEKGTTSFMTLVPKNSDIRSFKDLEGKTVAVSSLKGTWEVSVKEAIAKDEGDPSKVKLVQIAFGEQAAALKAGRVDAAVLLQPFAAGALAEGNRSIGDQHAIALDDPEGTSNILFMSTKFMSENPDAAKRFTDALTETTEYLKANPKEWRDILIKESGAPPAVIDSAPLPNASPVLKRANVEKWSELLEKYDIMETAPPADKIVWEGAPAQ